MLTNFLESYLRGDEVNAVLFRQQPVFDAHTENRSD